MSITAAGAVLAGGRSSRYGRAKMFEIYNGKPLYQYSLDAFEGAGIEKRYIITNEQLAGRFDSSQASIIIETEPFSGPLAALKEALCLVEPDSWLFLLAADVPFVTAEFVAALLEKAEASPDKQAVIPLSAGRFQPLHGLYHSSCLTAAEKAGSENSSMKTLLDEINVLYVEFPDTQKDFININRPEDWKHS
ncbi:molybdenum cofactor guanylyltransferase [Sinobaca qinghaiensis]|uniref:Probable molybdenum cofactor guanylyltransferase n=1 Tax=Sinobaca qinghaiensis TaxID=342944 RepID=A0A419V4G1_9BACL|nr:molybdenum cofactor guanylyltransferase [Sinobaca qinghaiensis]RKD73408.1 molybdenum cofactor guanylyltransferase [Sinobaca qinghaiensis]